ncbi:Auxin-induced protein 5NG4 [Hordeum vulgare]|nr:Auxin-induced protein 5NG4 [Hordeum vulgare]
MQFYCPTYRMLATVPEMRYPAGFVVENTICVWAISRWRGLMELSNYFLAADYHHLPPDSPVLFLVEEVRVNCLVIDLIARITNCFDAYFLLGKVF